MRVESARSIPPRSSIDDRAMVSNRHEKPRLFIANDTWVVRSRSQAIATESGSVARG
ncbi:hypothetical protein [Chamaesiphon sp. VAR_69_metabat_338]|uniref:hypothetical protein n=1 Tax=Chamaesiphon sp. VAR_69_metabat_338 TaxID=2964704 RepID=UPI00286DCC33|nr:hypothetical protein [Chamaesiphon sp. VAR_69_metabat_338]